ncbi:MAG: leucine-rich repeat protein [Clostridia bacterium]|nr:leucine-rich repeat protein [Clostridia bacterium]
MSLLRKKVKKSAIAVLSVSLCTALSAGLLLADFKGGNSVDASSYGSLSFTDVTSELDTSDLVKKNFNSSVLSAPAATYETRTVIVSLEGKSLLQAKSSGETVAEYAESSVGFRQLRTLDQTQKDFLNRLNSKKISYTLKGSYSAIANAVAIEVDTSYVSKIKEMSGVVGVEIGRTYLAPQTVEANTKDGVVVNDSFVYETGIYDSHDYSGYDWGTGAGTVVAVIDTGLDYTHSAFQQMPPEKDTSLKKDAVAEKLQNTTAFKRVTALGGSLTTDDVYINQKVPFAFDYADTDADVYPSYSNHGTHVAGIIGGHDVNGYDIKVGDTREHRTDEFLGVAPDAQLVICKTFTDNLDDPSLGGAESEAIMGALEDCVVLGVDVINMSLGSTAGFSSTDDGDEEGTIFNKIFSDIQDSGISLICAASNDYSAGFGSVYGTNLASNPDSATVGSPSTYYAALSVASVNGRLSEYMLDSNNQPIYFDNSSDGNFVSYDFVDLMLGNDPTTGEPVQQKEFEYVVVGAGQTVDYMGLRSLVSGRIALIQRGGNTFQEKVELASLNGAIGVIVYNNVSGTISMSLGDVSEEDFIPAVSITMDAGKQLKANAGNGTNGSIGKITISRSLASGPFMSAFSSWGPTPDLKIKPEITAHGGEITSTVPGGYAEQSGTSMASPNMAGLTALVRNYVKSLDLANGMSASQITQLTNQLIMSTATSAFNEEGLAYSPRKQGAGLANLGNIVSTGAYIFTDEESDGKYYYEEKDGRPKMEIGDDSMRDEKGVYTFSFKVRNFGSDVLNFTPEVLFMTETIASDGISVAEKAHMLDDNAPVFTVDGNNVSKISLGVGETKTVTVKLTLSADEMKYIETNFVNGMYVEGFVKLIADGDKQCDLTLPFLGFYGDWEQAPMLDMDAYELAKLTQNTSLDEEEKPSATVWATQPYASYYGENYIIPLGSFVYTPDPDPTKPVMYTNMEYNAISRYDVAGPYDNEDGIGNYRTTYNIRCVYAGLLRNARYVRYYVYDETTGERVAEGQVNRISKAYANSGSARPAYVELKIAPDDIGLLNNGKYRFDVEFLFNENSVPMEENTFSFDFYVDYESPVLQDARLRYSSYKEGNREKQRIYLDLDVYDNHYAQSIMLCYMDYVNGEQVLNLATDYITPVTNPNKNGVTTVTVEVTDFWDEYKDNLYVQIDDYALNHASYYLGSFGGSSMVDATTAVNRSVLPDEFTIPDSERNITININEAHKFTLEYEGSADISNFIMSVGGSTSTQNPYMAVKNGEVVGLKSTNGVAQPVTISNGKGFSDRVWVTVTDTVDKVSSPEFGFNVIRSSTDSLVKAKHSGSITVNAGEDIQLQVVPDPWYYPMDDVDITWSYRGSSITVSDDGLVHTVAKGSSTVSATVVAGGIRYTVTFTFNVADPFTVSSMALTRYHGDGDENGVVIIPEGKNIMSIGEDAFKDNTKITKVIIPQSVTSIGKNAFKGCTNLKEVYFISEEEVDYTAKDFVSKSGMTLIDRNAFEGCTSLEKLDLSNVKVISVAREAFKDCENLTTIVKSTAIGTMYDRAFMGCKSLTKIDISGLHSAGANVFSGCENLSNVITGRYTAIGAGMFSNLEYEYAKYNYTSREWEILKTDYSACNSLNTITIKSNTVGVNAFANCTGLTSVEFDATDAGDLEVIIGAGAFENCANLTSVDFGSCTVKIIGERAFADCAKLTDANFKLPNGLETIGANAFGGTNLTFNGQSGYTVRSNALISGTTLLYYFGTGSADLTGITKIAPYAFAGSNVTSVTIPSTVTEIGEGAFANSKLKSVTINANLTAIPAYAFYNTELTTVTLPNTVTSVGDYALAGNKLLDTFNFAPTNKATFGNGVFGGCVELVSITLHDNIIKLGDRTFVGCTALNTVTLPSLVSTDDFTALGDYTFFNTPNLERVVFGVNSNTTGNYTFAADYARDRASLTSVTLGSAVTKIGDYAFYNCGSLTGINLYNATEIGEFAFAGCTALESVTGLNNIVTVNDYAFANCSALTSLELNSAETIGEGAFSVNGNNAYTSISIPKAVSVGAFAFAGGREATVEIPASLKEIGYGAFAYSSNLTEFNVASGNDTFFVIDGVLFENVKNLVGGETVNTGKYSLVAFPSAKTVEKTDGVAVYTLPDETVKVGGSAFSGLTGGVQKVVLPYGLKKLGASAFYASGITEYEFKGATAPILETDYSAAIDVIMDGDTTYRGYYYANFEGDFIFYANMASGATPVKLTIYRPENGTGYDNYVFSNYFGESVLTEATKSEATNSFIELVTGFASASEISGWKEPEMSKADVIEFADNVKKAHEYYNTFSGDEYQLSFVDPSLITKFNEIETALRAVKAAYNIPVTISRLTYTGSFKSEYKVGERFDITGLQVVIIYDDYSTENADMSKVTYDLHDPLTELNNVVELTYEGRTLFVRINVTSGGNDAEAGGCGGGCGSTSSISGTMIFTFTAIGLMFVFSTISRRKNRGNR